VFQKRKNELQSSDSKTRMFVFIQSLCSEKKIVVYRRLCLCKKINSKLRFFFRSISFIYKLYKLIMRNHDIIQSIIYL
jgi:hypothetical protein